MGPGYFILAVMGCGDGATLCQEIERRETTYQTHVECMADSEMALDAALDEPYPMLIADCRRVAAQLVDADARPAG